jgi:hypothetical protein
VARREYWERHHEHHMAICAHAVLDPSQAPVFAGLTVSTIV